METKHLLIKIRILASILLLSLVTSACNEPSKKTSTKNAVAATQKSYFRDNHPTFQKWKNYYSSLDPKLSGIAFIQSSEQKQEDIPGTVHATFDKEFDPVYLPFLVYSPDKSRYIDFDSYQWSLINGEPQFEVDQEVNLVDTKNKTVRRIAFRGPSAVIEEVYWKNNATVVMLENFDSVPIIHVIDLVKKTEKTYTGTMKVKAQSAYFTLRLQDKLTTSTKR